MVSVLRYLGKDSACECRVMALAGTTAEAGTTPGGLRRAAAFYRVPVEQWEGASLEDVCGAVRGGRPVLLALQAWAEGSAASAIDYRQRWDDGHWVAMTATGPRRLLFMDPSLPGARASLTRGELLRRWRDIDVPGEPYERLALVFPAREDSSGRWQTVKRTQRMG